MATDDRDGVNLGTISGSYGLRDGFVGTTCDFDGDADCDVGDLNAMLSVGPVAPGIPSIGNEPFDLTGDGLIDNSDVDQWLADAALINGFATPYKRGDATLDGIVDGRDFGIWNAHKFTSTLLWDQGNFDGNAVTDGGDFGFWNANKFTSSAAAAAVPEPAAVAIWRLASILVLCEGLRAHTVRRPEGLLTS